MSDQGQVPDQTATGQAPNATVSTSNATAPQSPDFAALQREVAELRKEAADRRVAAKTASEEAAKRAAEAGDYKALADQYKARIDELSAYEAKAKSWDAYEQREVSEIMSARGEMPPQVQADVEAAPTLEAKRAIFAAWRAGKQSSTQRAAPIPAANPATQAAAMSIDQFGSADDVRRAAESDPSKFRDMLAKLANAGRPQSAIGAMLARK